MAFCSRHTPCAWITIWALGPEVTALTPFAVMNTISPRCSDVQDQKQNAGVSNDMDAMRLPSGSGQRCKWPLLA
ncbi:hypothetical protein SKAU_G00122570 [Synaphobranchus kaupii]|uniref:Uncharacterized protein n=1 Tax=Synaphobranchus kaupii TaxID=118154 RepID=A0A9Q1J266_SYNKA|nr:hypothetical protein SKAU_G00122570 [Synaphobranchus kaupii]